MSEALVPFLPYPLIEKTEDKFWLDYDRPQSVGKIGPFFGTIPVLVRAYAGFARSDPNRCAVSRTVGGTVASHLRVGSPLASHTLFGVYLGIIVWAALWCRMPTLRRLLPINPGEQP